MHKPLVVIAGPTACGKTDAAIQLAKEIDGEIISADSMQVYKYMDIGTAKPTRSEMEGVPHYLIDELAPDEEYSIAVFQKKAKAYLEQIHQKGKIPILCGGTGFYINALVYNNDFMETQKDTTRRDALYGLAAEKGNDYVHQLLRTIDPVAAEQIHLNNVKRVVRAIEYFEQTGQPISTHNETEKQRTLAYDTRFFVLNRERAQLYERINFRVDQMMEQGLVAEVQRLLAMGYAPQLTSMQGLGYKEIVAYLNGDYTLAEAVEILKRDTRHFAKRQLTWFRHQNDGIWIDVAECSDIVGTMKAHLSTN